MPDSTNPLETGRGAGAMPLPPSRAILHPDHRLKIGLWYKMEHLLYLVSLGQSVQESYKKFLRMGKKLVKKGCLLGVETDII